MRKTYENLRFLHWGDIAAVWITWQEGTTRPGGFAPLVTNNRNPEKHEGT